MLRLYPKIRPWRLCRRMLRLAMLGGVALPAMLAADEPPKPLTGQVQLESGLLVDYAVHFNRSAIQASVRLEKGLIASTSSGSLLRFELPEAQPVRERTDVQGLTCLARGEGESVFAGFGDGRVCRLDPETLELAEVAKLPGEVDWIGWSKAERGGKTGLVVVTSRVEHVERDGRREEVRSDTVQDLATGKSFDLESRPSAFLIDREGRLWLGADRGEWGGWVVRIDLIQEKVEKLDPPPTTEPGEKAYWHGVLGFLELADGEIWAFGGSAHMGIARGAITRVDGAAPQTLYHFVYPEDPLRRQEPAPDQPIMPFTHVLEESGGLLVFSYSDVFRVDKAFKSWKAVATLDIDYRWGRRDAVGMYPTVNAVLPPTREGEPYVITTDRNGILLLEGTKVTPLSVPGQFGASDVSEIRNTSEGILFLSDDGRSLAWRLGAEGWEPLQLAPPFEIDPAGDAALLEKDAKAWNETKVLVGPGGAIYTVSGTDVDEGTRTTARWVDGKSELLGRQTSALAPGACFITSDGTLWCNSDYLRRFEAGRWKTVARVADPYPYSLSPVTADGPPWLLLDRSNGGLFRLDQGARGDDPRLTWVSTKEGETKAAIPWSEGGLLATDAGLRIYEPATRRLTKFDLDAPIKSVTSMARDGLGRLWLGCEDGLRLVEVGAKTPESLDRVPGVRRSQVACLAADPLHEDGVIAVIDSEAAVFIRASRKP